MCYPMWVVKLDDNEMAAVRGMANVWAGDNEVVDHSSGRVTKEGLLEMVCNLPYVEPPHQPYVELMLEFFEADEDMLPERVYGSLGQTFG